MNLGSVPVCVGPFVWEQKEQRVGVGIKGWQRVSYNWFNCAQKTSVSPPFNCSHISQQLWLTAWKL